MHRLAAVPGSSSPADGVVFIEQPPAAEEAYTYEKVPVTVLCTILKGILKRNKKTVPYRCGIGTGQKIWIICIIL